MQSKSSDKHTHNSLTNKSKPPTNTNINKNNTQTYTKIIINNNQTTNSNQLNNIINKQIPPITTKHPNNQQNDK